MNNGDPELPPRAHADIQRLDMEVAFLRQLGEESAADKIAALRDSTAKAWAAFAVAQAERERLRGQNVVQTRRPALGNKSAAEDEDEETRRRKEARALAPAYDYIRALVARWAAERAPEGD